AADKKVVIETELNELPPALGDSDMLRRVLQNLVDNALKFTRPRSTVSIRGTLQTADDLPPGHALGTWLRIQVEDAGRGIPPEFHTIIFELFAQAPAGYGRGTGVGLAFCKLAVEAHGGQIWVESTFDRGSSFFFTLPIAS